MRYKTNRINNSFLRWVSYKSPRVHCFGLMASLFTGLLYVSIMLMISPNNFELYHRTFRSSLQNNVKVCCMVLTAPKYYLTRAKAVNETWGKRCDTLYFISESEKGNDPTYGLNVPFIPNLVSGYDYISMKSRLGFVHMYKNCRLNHDWFIKADDDTYVIMEHLKNFLQDKNSSKPVTFGYNYKMHVAEGYHSGGASYVLSREALRRFYFIHEIPESPCHQDGDEDVRIAYCLRLVKVFPGNSLDNLGREMFHPYNFSTHFSGPFTESMHKWAMNPMLGVSDSVFRHYLTMNNEEFSYLSNSVKSRLWLDE